MCYLGLGEDLDCFCPCIRVFIKVNKSERYKGSRIPETAHQISLTHVYVHSYAVKNDNIFASLLSYYACKELMIITSTYYILFEPGIMLYRFVSRQ